MLPESRREFADTTGRTLPDTLQHIAQIVVGIDLVQSASHDQARHDAGVPSAKFKETVRQSQKNTIKPWQKRIWCIPPQQNAVFVCQLEEVLEVYQ